MADATNVIAEGEVLQLMNAHDPDTTEARYLDVIHRKTAQLFQAAPKSPRCQRRVPAHRRALARASAGTSEPPTSSSTTSSTTRRTRLSRGKNLGDDLAEGKPTLPLIYALQRGNAGSAP